MIVAACAFFAVSAESPMATLSHNGELSFFTNLLAFESALNAAVNGDTIYLSAGDFTLAGGALTINKRVSVVGNGYGTHILGDLNIDMRENPNSEMKAPLFDGVRLDKLNFDSSKDSRINLGETEVRRCWIRELIDGAEAGNNVIYDKCVIDYSDFYGYGAVCVKNSKITGHGNIGDYMCNITAINCNITNAYYYPRNTISCILKKGSGFLITNGTVSILNSLLDFTPSTSSNVYTDACYIYSDENVPLLDENMDCPLNLTELGYLGQDGTVVGIQGGQTPFSENPSMPTVDVEKSSVVYDAESDKLKVSITVKAD